MTAAKTTATKEIKVAKQDATRKEFDMRVGDTVKVYQKIQEKGKTRLQVFEGLILARKHGNEAGATFTVRKVSGGYGVERIFPLFSPSIDKIEVVKRAKVRRAKLYYIRDKAAKEISKRMKMEMTKRDSSHLTKAEAARLEAEEAANAVVAPEVEIAAEETVVTE
ncbi:MAG: 50S ribosomal protein L19 [bacterium]